MASMKRRVDRLEDERQRQTGADEAVLETMPATDEFFEMEVENIALHLIRGIEPDFTLDETDAFVTLDGRFAVSRRRMDLRGLMGPRTEELQASIPPERWGRFLMADEEATNLLERLLELAEDASVPDNYREPGYQWHDHGEVCDRLGQHEFGSAFADAGEREATRRLTWTLIHDPDATAMLSELTRRRDAFVAEEEASNG